MLDLGSPNLQPPMQQNNGFWQGLLMNAKIIKSEQDIQMVSKYLLPNYLLKEGILK